MNTDDCWLYAGYINNAGYGWMNYHTDIGTTMLAHRAMYEHFVGEIPEGLQIDHLCRVRSCVNPDHLEPVTRSENQRRRHMTASWTKALCIRGHPLTDDNVIVSVKDKKTGRIGRQCRRCASELSRIRRELKRKALTTK